jgi:hypothetical protein
MDKLRIGQKLSLSMLLLIIANIMTGINNAETIGNYLTKVVLLSLLTIPLFLVKKEFPKKILSWVLLVLSIPTLMAEGSDPSNMNGIFLFLFSVSLAPKSKKVYLIFFSLFTASLLYRFNLAKMTPSQIIEYIAGVSFIGIFYQEYIHPKKQTEYTANYNNTVIEKIYIDIMKLYLNGYSWKQISTELKLSITAKSVQRLLDKEWKDRKFKNREQFAHYLGQMGIINNVDKNLITE